MRHVSTLLLVALLACRSEPSPAPSGSNSAMAAPSAAAPELRAVVRIDPTSFEATTLGRVRVAGAPPYLVELVEGGDALRALVDEMNAVDHVMSAGVTMPPQRVERSSTDFFRILQHGWLKTERHVELRLPASGPRPARRFEVWSAADGKLSALGTVDVDAMDYLLVVGGPDERRAGLGRLVAHRNAKEGESVQIPPPDGERDGKWGRLVARGTPLHFAMMRDELLLAGVLLTPEGRKPPTSFTVEGPTGRFSDRRWLSTHVPPELRVVPPGQGEHLHVEGPRPLALRALAYGGVKHDAASLRAHVARHHGATPGFTFGEAGELEAAGRKLLALAFRTGDGADAAAKLVALWPELRHDENGDALQDRGVALELTIAAGAAPPTLADFAAHPTLGAMLDALHVDLDAIR